MRKDLIGRCAARSLGVAAALALSTTVTDAQEVHRLAGPDVALYNLAGRVEIVPGRDAEVVVRVTRGGRDAGRLAVETGPVNGRETLRVVYPADEVVYPALGRGSRTQLTVAADGTFSGGRSSGGGRVTIRGTGEGLEAWADLVVEVPPGRSVATFLAVGSAEATGVRADLIVDTGAGRVSAREVAGSLSIDTGSGAVDVDGLEGELSVDTGSGGITVASVRGGRIDLDTGSGTVSVRDVGTGELRVDTGSGRIEVSGARAPVVHLDTGSGSVEVEVVAELEELIVDTGSGRVVAVVPANVGAEIHVETGSGRIDVDLPMQVQTLRRDEVRGTIGDGRGRIVIGTGSGSITVNAGS